jgi:predicted RNase H-like nuclease (RuvC/YqgF family)
MDEEKLQRQMDFIVEQQAKFVEDIAQLQQQTRENREDIAKLVNVVMSLANHVERHDQQIGFLIEQSTDTDRKLKENAERSREIDERLNALILLVERYFNRNGQ